MHWDLFCRVIDNFGDMGVCWRLARDLAHRGHRVRLWADDVSMLTWMAPEVSWHHSPDLGFDVGTGHPGIKVCHWSDAAQADRYPALEAGDVVIEAFGCDLPEAFLARMQRPQPPQWINLEYLSAEDYVERSHGLYSPVWHGPAAGLRKRFFYPGFTTATGGLLRELTLEQDLLAWNDHQRTQWLAQHGVNWQPGDKVVSVFCYPTAPLTQWLAQWRQQAAQTTHVLLAHGHATQMGLAWQAQQNDLGQLQLHPLPALSQPEFDRMLWSSDLNFVRGEDSAIRALWACKPHVWQIYQQDDGVHADKLHTFMNRWMPQWPQSLRDDITRFWLGWNALADLPASTPNWVDPTSEWLTQTLKSRENLQAQTDLTTQLIHFVSEGG